MAWEKINITTESGALVSAQAPIIISASRSTDIPAFYADWFFHRLKVGYSVWTNPFNGIPGHISYANTRFIVFWSKNPRPLLEHIDDLEEKGIGCYIQFTLNDYEKEGLEKGVPPLNQRIETFKLLVERLGKGHVIWRFDPMILTEDISIDKLIEKVKVIGDQLKGYTEKLVFSYADIASYRKVKANLDKSGIGYREWDEPSMVEFAKRLSALNKAQGWDYELATCGEQIDIVRFGISHNKCIDDDLMIRIAHKDPVLMKFLHASILPKESSLFEPFELPQGSIDIDDLHYAIKTKDNKDAGQRQFCGCAVSKDIGQYDTCPHMCEYCYANTSKESAVRNWQRHKSNPLGDKIIG